MRQGTNERRSAERFNTNLKGQIVCDSLASSVECLLWDISETGARLVVSRPAEIPLEFELLIPDEDASARVRLVWSNGKDHGVAFTD
jgi:hypothetical protein